MQSSYIMLKLITEKYCISYQNIYIVYILYLLSKEEPRGAPSVMPYSWTYCKSNCTKMENKMFTSYAVMTFCMLHADTKELMIHAGKYAQMLYLQSSSIRHFFERFLSNRQHILADFLLDYYWRLRLTIATHCPSFSLTAPRKTLNLEAKIAARIVHSQMQYL